MRAAALWIAAIATMAGASLLAARLTAPPESQEAPGCGPLRGTIDIGDRFTPWEGRFGYSDDPPLARTGHIVRSGEAAGLVPFSLAELDLDLPLRATLFQGVDDFDADGKMEPAIIRYYADAEWTRRTTFVGFVEAGGVEVRQRLAGGFDADLVRSQLGARAIDVTLGPHLAALTHGDPISERGTRPFYLTWSDGETDLQIVADMPVAQLVAAARSIYCQP